MKRHSYLKYMITALTLAWMGVIFWFSAQPAVQSADMSGGIVEKLQGMTVNVPVIGQLFASEFAEHILRKGAHVAEYAVLGGLLSLCMNQYLPEKVGRLTKYRTLIAFSIGVLYATSDEFHQTFVSGRSGEIKDVCIDSVGVMVGIILIWLFGRLWKNVNKSRERVEKLAIK